MNSASNFVNFDSFYLINTISEYEYDVENSIQLFNFIRN